MGTARSGGGGKAKAKIVKKSAPELRLRARRFILRADAASLNSPVGGEAFAIRFAAAAKQMDVTSE
jgi:hypothetical protein